MRENIEFTTIDEAINRLIQYKMQHGNNVTVCMVNLDNGEEKKEKKTIEEGCEIIKSSLSVVLNNDDFIPHIMAFTNASNDINILPMAGKMHDIFLFSNRKTNRARTNVRNILDTN